MYYVGNGVIEFSCYFIRTETQIVSIITELYAVNQWSNSVSTMISDHLPSENVGWNDLTIPKCWTAEVWE